MFPLNLDGMKKVRPWVRANPIKTNHAVWSGPGQARLLTKGKVRSNLSKDTCNGKAGIVQGIVRLMQISITCLYFPVLPFFIFVFVLKYADQNVDRHCSERTGWSHHSIYIIVGGNVVGPPLRVHTHPLVSLVPSPVWSKRCKTYWPPCLAHHTHSINVYLQHPIYFIYDIF